MRTLLILLLLLPTTAHATNFGLGETAEPIPGEPAPLFGLGLDAYPGQPILGQQVCRVINGRVVCTPATYETTSVPVFEDFGISDEPVVIDVSVEEVCANCGQVHTAKTVSHNSMQVNREVSVRGHRVQLRRGQPVRNVLRRLLPRLAHRRQFH